MTADTDTPDQSAKAQSSAGEEGFSVEWELATRCNEFCNLVVRLTSAIHDTEVLRLASGYLFSAHPPTCFIRFLHSLETFTDTATFTPGGGVSRERSPGPPPADSAAATAMAGSMSLVSTDSGCLVDAFGDWREASAQHKAVSLYTAPVRCRGKAVGALTVGSTEADAFSGDASEGLELVAALVAPYLQIKEVRRELQVKQTCLRDSLPPSVASHMLERRGATRLGPGLGIGLGSLRSMNSDYEDVGGSSGSEDDPHKTLQPEA